MVEDLKQDSRNWREEKKRKGSHAGYSESNTAARRLDSGASGQPTIPQKTRELTAARRGESVQPQGQGMIQPTGTQLSSNRHQSQQDMAIQPNSVPSNFYQPDPAPRHQSTYPGQLAYGSPTTSQSRPPPAMTLNLNMNTASYTQSGPQRHQSPPQSNVLPSIEGRSGYYTPAPAYEEEDGKGGQPPVTGTHGFASMNPTAGSRHDRR